MAEWDRLLQTTRPAAAFFRRRGAPAPAVRDRHRLLRCRPDPPACICPGLPVLSVLYPLLGRWWCSICPFMVSGSEEGAGKAWIVVISLMSRPGPLTSCLPWQPAAACLAPCTGTHTAPAAPAAPAVPAAPGHRRCGAVVALQAAAGREIHEVVRQPRKWEHEHVARWPKGSLPWVRRGAPLGAAGAGPMLHPATRPACLPRLPSRPA